MYQLSKYTIFYPLDDLNGMLFNTFKGKLVVIPKKIFENLPKTISEEELKENFKEHTLFIKENFFINIHNKEKDNKIIDVLMNNKYKKDKLVVTIMTTLACNLGCVYCYQQGLVSRDLHLKKEVAVAIKNWFIERIETLQPSEVICHFYGGEPLLNLDILEDIIPEVMETAKQNGAKFSSYVTTNGTLMNQKNIDRLKEWNLDNAQISLDGPKLIHDQRRALLNGKGSYESIIKNIGLALKEGIKVVVRINIDKHNIDYLDELFLELKKLGYNKYKNLQINLEIVSPIMNPSEHCKKYIYSSEEEMRTLCGLWEKQVKHGFPIKSAMPIDSACENMMKHSYTISSNGDMYMCPGFIGIEHMKIGNILTEIEKEKYDSLLKVNHWEKCCDCEYLPVCQGGCKMCAYVTTNDFNSIYCRKGFLETIYPEFLKYKFLYKQNKLEERN